MEALPDTLVLAVGDTHAGHLRAIELVDAAVEAGCRRVLQVGDFGWFPRMWWGERFIADLDECCSSMGIVWCFIGGNHDDWEDLEALSSDDGAERDDDGFVIVGKALRYIPRPHRWEWHGVRFAAMGGAWSIDQANRTPMVNWWPQEQPRLIDAVEVIDGGVVDVMVCHDAPGEVNLGVAGWGGNDRGGGEATRTLIDMLVCAVTPRVLVHGHWHWRHTTKLSNGCRVEGLADHQSHVSEQCAVLDLATLELTPPSTPLPTRAPWWQP